MFDFHFVSHRAQSELKNMNGWKCIVAFILNKNTADFIRLNVYNFICLYVYHGKVAIRLHLPHCIFVRSGSGDIFIYHLVLLRYLCTATYFFCHLFYIMLHWIETYT